MPTFPNADSHTIRSALRMSGPSEKGGQRGVFAHTSPFFVLDSALLPLFKHAANLEGGTRFQVYCLCKF